MIKYKVGNFFLASIVFILTISSSLLYCSSKTPSNSNSEEVTLVNSSPTIQTKLDTVKQEPDLLKIYSQAIGDFIEFANKEYKLSFDTLFFGKHEFGQPDDFPEIELPSTIQNTPIKLISPEQGKKILTERNSSFYINLIGLVNLNNAEFIFVTFSNSFSHQFDYYVTYNYNPKKQVFEYNNSRFENFQYHK